MGYLAIQPMEPVFVQSAPSLSYHNSAPAEVLIRRVESKREACKQEIKAFAIGGPGGLARLRQVLPSIFAYFEIITLAEKSCILRECGLTPLVNAKDISFEIQGLDSDSSV